MGCFFFARTIGINGFSMFLLPWPSPLTTVLLTYHWTRWFCNGFGVIKPLPFNDFQPPDHWFQWFFDGFQILETNAGQRWFLKIYTPKSARLHWSLMKYETRYKTVTHIYLGYYIYWVEFLIDNHLAFEPDTHRYISVGYSRITTNQLSSPMAQNIFPLAEVKELVRHNFDKVSQNLTL